jgi:hypothetical protein
MYERRIENSVIKLMKELKRFQVMRRIELEDAEKRQASEPSPMAEKKSDLKKQSQFVPDEINSKSYATGDYDNLTADGAEENKANRTCPFSKFRAGSEHVERSQFQGRPVEGSRDKKDAGTLVGEFSEPQHAGPRTII